jgi:hypothetical protein
MEFVRRCFSTVRPVRPRPSDWFAEQSRFCPARPFRMGGVRPIHVLAQVREKLAGGLEMAPNISRTDSGSIEQGCYLHHMLST